MVETKPAPNGEHTVERISSINDEKTETEIESPLSEKDLKLVHTRRERVQFATLSLSLFLAGWNDGSTGPLLPRIQEVYHVGFAVVSLIFVFACVGFISAAFANVWLTEKLGFGKVIVLGCVCQLAGYSILAPAPPFPAFVFGFVINGFGLALQDSQANGYVASLKDNAETKMGILHAVYGAGALCSPLVATQFAQMKRWSFHYLVSLGITMITTAFLIAVFRFKTQDECLAQIGHPAGEKGTSEETPFRQIMSLKSVHLLAIFILVYVGVEESWSVTYVIRERGGGSSSGYVSAGFFGGLMLGRVALLWINKKVGERRVIFLYAIIAIGLQLIVWLVPHLIGDAVAVSLIGVVLGPMYPIAMNQSARILPPWLLTGSIGYIAGLGQGGSAVLPFMTGALASKFSITSLQPLLVSMMAFMMFLWALVPNRPHE